VPRRRQVVCEDHLKGGKKKITLKRVGEKPYKALSPRLRSPLKEGGKETRPRKERMDRNLRGPKRKRTSDYTQRGHRGDWKSNRGVKLKHLKKWIHWKEESYFPQGKKNGKRC